MPMDRLPIMDARQGLSSVEIHLASHGRFAVPPIAIKLRVEQVQMLETICDYAHRNRQIPGETRKTAPTFRL